MMITVVEQSQTTCGISIVENRVAYSYMHESAVVISRSNLHRSRGKRKLIGANEFSNFPTRDALERSKNVLLDLDKTMAPPTQSHPNLQNGTVLLGVRLSIQLRILSWHHNPANLHSLDMMWSTNASVDTMSALTSSLNKCPECCLPLPIHRHCQRCRNVSISVAAIGVELGTKHRAKLGMTRL
mmetsp:Transcript_65674/g.102526  ORF Transcript_65674/g.102526 Transcript_65674/m.102526 type:complete len:184 (-) Transcript_65674:2433-2984(-)